MEFFTNFFRFPRDVTSVAPEVVFELGGFPITNTLLLEFLIILLVGVFGFFVVRGFNSGVPTKFQNSVEAFYESIINFVDQITGSKEMATKVFPLVGAILVYIGIANLIGIIPGLTSLEYGQVAIFRTPTTDFNTTLGLALAVVRLLVLFTLFFRVTTGLTPVKAPLELSD